MILTGPFYFGRKSTQNIPASEPMSGNPGIQPQKPGEKGAELAFFLEIV
jgi:hypothetical protein